MKTASRATLLLVLAAGGCSYRAAGSGGDDGSGHPAGDAGTSGGSDGSNAAGQTPTQVRLTMHHQPTNAAPFSYLVAYRDGSGPWALAPAPSGEVYTLPIYAPVYAIAWTCISPGPQPNSTARQVSEIQLAVAERTSLTVEVPPRCRDTVGTATLRGTLANPSFSASYAVKWGEYSARVTGGQFVMQVAPGTHDLIVLAARAFGPSGDAITADAIVRRGVAVSGTTELALDADEAQGTRSYVVNDLHGGQRQTAATTLYAHGTTAVLVTDSSSPFRTEALAADQIDGDDVYDQQLTVGSAAGIMSSSSATATPDDETWVDVPALAAVTATATAAPNPRVTATWTPYPNATGYTWSATQSMGGFGPSAGCGGSDTLCTITWIAQLSAGVLGDQGTYTMPDLTMLAGWNPALQMVAGSRASGGVQAMTSSRTGDFPPLVPPAVGTRRTFATGLFGVTP